MAAELVGSGSYDHSSQVRGSGSSPRPMVRGGARITKWGGGSSPIRNGAGFLVVSLCPRHLHRIQ